MTFTGWIPDVIADETIESAWGNTIRDRTVTPFPNAAARDAAITAPKAGMVVWMDDAKALYVYSGTVWVSLGKGRLAYNLQTASDRGQGVATVNTVSFTLPTSRIVRLDGAAQGTEITAAGNGNVGIACGFDGARPVNFTWASSLGLNYVLSGCALWQQTLAAGTHTADLQVSNNSTVGAVRFLAGAGFLAVTDMGAP